MSKKKSFTRAPWFFTAEAGDEGNTTLMLWKNNERFKVLKHTGDRVATDSVTSVSVSDDSGHQFPVDDHPLEVCGTMNEGTWSHIFFFSKYDFSKPGSLNQELRHLNCSSPDVLISVIQRYIQSQGGGSHSSEPETHNPTSDDGKKSAPKKGKKKKDSESVFEEIDLTISTNFIGQYEVRIDQLKQPPPEWQIRPIHPEYVAELKKAITATIGHEHFTEPVVALVDADAKELTDTTINRYKLNVVGGLHRVTAQRELLQETSDARYKTRRCSVYSSKMPLEAILRLANQHNLANSLNRKTTFLEHVQKCRELLFATFGDGRKDDGKHMPPVPHYNHHSYIDWKKLCYAHIIGPGVGPAYADQAIQLSREQPNVYVALRKVFTMMESGKLKGQKSGCGQEGKIHHYKVFQGLEDTQKCSLLQQLSRQEITFAEAKQSASKTKSMKKHQTKLEPIKEVLSKAIGLDYNDIATNDIDIDERLLDFVDKMDPEKPSEEFKLFCTEVKVACSASGSITDSGVDSADVAEFKLNENKVTLVVTDNLAVDYNLFFMGLDTQDSQAEQSNLLIIGTIPEAWTHQHISLLFNKVVEVGINHTMCLIAGEKHVTDILTEGKKLEKYSMVCAYGKTEKSVDIVHKPSQGVLKYARMERTTFPLFVLTNWQHGASTGQGNTFVGKTVGDVAQDLVVSLSDKYDIVLLLAGFPFECIKQVVESCSANNRLVVAFVNSTIEQDKIVNYFHQDMDTQEDVRMNSTTTGRKSSSRGRDSPDCGPPPKIPRTRSRTEGSLEWSRAINPDSPLT